jgi:predicted RNase H-like nuclease
VDAVTLAGIDGCPAGWVAAIQVDTEVELRLASCLKDLVAGLPARSLLAIDMPIGLPEAGPRECDVLARRRLGAARGASVFAAPVRAVLNARDYATALARHRRADGRGLSRQAFNILPMIREVDRLLASWPNLRRRMIEVHPESSFARWNGGAPIPAGKKTREGRQQRSHLVDTRWPGLREAFLALTLRREVAEDDILDAFAALWSAERYARGEALCLPERRVRDTRGLWMAIHI